MFSNLIGETMEVYIDDMLAKSLKATNHTEHLKAAFGILKKYQMKLNPLKCVFDVALGKFLGYMVNQHGIEAKPDKIKTLLNMRSPSKPKEVQRLTSRLAALNRFISKAKD